MTDIADRAESDIEVELDAAIRMRKPPSPIARGICYYCGEIIDQHLRWCVGTECEREWEREKQRRAANQLPD